MDKSDMCIYGYLLILSVCSIIYGVVVVVQSDTNSSLYVNVVLPLNSVNNPGPLATQLATLNSITKTFTVTVWWGLVEGSNAGVYEWSAYNSLFYDTILANVTDARIKVDFAFHACNDLTYCETQIPLPEWVTNKGPEIFYTDVNGNSSFEYISAGLDHVPLFEPNNRTATQVYSSLIQSFLYTFSALLDTHIFEIQVGLGAKGELSYPAFPDGVWTIPGIGQFQSYDKYLASEYFTYASKSGHPEWAFLPQANWLAYNDEPSKSLFFNDNAKNFNNGSTSDYGSFFVQWYSNRLVQHGASILSQASSMLKTFSPNVTLAARVGCVYWLSADDSHAAEITAGYSNYTAIVDMLSTYNIRMEVDCFDLSDKAAKDSYSKAANPENLLGELVKAAKSVGIKVEGTNTNINTYNYNTIESNCRKDVGTVIGVNIRYLSDSLLSNVKQFKDFVDRMNHPAKLK